MSVNHGIASRGRPFLGPQVHVRIPEESTGVIGSIAWGSFCLLFPLFFIYHMALAWGWIPPLLGGAFGLFAAAVIVPLSFAYAYSWMQGSIRPNSLDAGFFLLMSYTVVVAIYNYGLGNLAGHFQMLIWSLSNILFNVVCFLVMRLLSPEIARHGKFVFFCSIVLGAAMIRNASGISEGAIIAAEGDAFATYQGFGRTLLVVFFMAFALSKRATVRLAIFMIGTLALFLNGGRTEFVLFVGAAATYEMIRTVMCRRSGVLGGVILGSMVIGALLAGQYAVESSRLESRILELLDVSSATSWVDRAHLTSVAIRTIAENPFWGSYGHYVINESGTGSYSHNLLSAWVNLGFPGFAGYVTVLGLAIQALWRFRVLASAGEARWGVAFLFVVYVIGAFVFSRAYYDEFFGLALGASACLAGAAQGQRERLAVIEAPGRP